MEIHILIMCLIGHNLIIIINQKSSKKEKKITILDEIGCFELITGKHSYIFLENKMN